MKWPAFFYPHSVSVRDYQAQGLGGGYGQPRPLDAEVRDEQRLVRSTDGEEVVSSTQVTIDIDEHVAPRSLVTVWPGTAAEREAMVIAVGRDENGVTGLDSFNRLYLE